MSHESDPITFLLLQLSNSRTPLQEYQVVQAVIKRKGPIGELLSYTGWHCVAQACSVIRPLLTDGQEAAVVSWFSLSHHLSNIHCVSGHHCSCHTVSLLSLLPVGIEKLAVFDRLLFSQCDTRKNCFLTSCLMALHQVVQSNFALEDRNQMFQRLLKLWPLLPRTGSNFVGEPIDSSFSPCIRWFILTYLTIMASETRDKSWCRKQLFNLRDMIAEITGDSETKGDLTKQMVHVFGDEDVKLISVTKSMMCILRDLSDMDAAQQMFRELAIAIHWDHSILVDWLTSDEETAVELLSLLVTYLKMPNDSISQPVRNLLIQLRDSCVRLTAKGLLPYNAEALLRLMRTL